MNVLLYFWLHDYGKVDSWHNKEIGSLPERASAVPLRFLSVFDDDEKLIQKKKTLPWALHERARRTAENANQIF